MLCPDCKWQSARVKSKEKAGTCPDCGTNLSSTIEIQDYKFHDNRHTFASHAVMNGVDLPTLAKLLGHRNIKMTMRYASLAKSHLVKAVDILDKAMGMPTDTKTDTLHKKGAS